MRKINVIAALTVLICNLIVSFNHSLDLFQAGGFHGYLAYVAVIGCEITFVMGALNIVVARMKDEHPGKPAILGGLLGVLLVGWSNVAAGWAYGITGILLGLATPISLIIAESILSRAVLQRTAQQSGEVAQVEEETDPQPPSSEDAEQEAAEDEEETTQQTPYEWAVHLYEQEQEPPSRRRLAQVANCTEWAARQALEQLKVQKQIPA